MRPNVLPTGPIQFRIHGIGFNKGIPYFIADVLTEGKNDHLTFELICEQWHLATDKESIRLNEEEQEMMKSIWDVECKKRGLKSG